MPPREPQSHIGERRALVAVLALSFLLNLVPLWWGLPSYQGWAFDEIGPKHLRTATWPWKYPPLHRYVLRAAVTPLDGLEALGLLDVPHLEGYSFRYGLIRLVSVLMATATIYLIYRCSRLMFSRWESVGAAAAVAFMPPFVYYAKTANLEAPYLFWFALSVFFFLRALTRQRLRDFLLFATFGALSICTKDQAYGLYLLTPIPLVAALCARGGGSSLLLRLRSALLDRRIWYSAAAVAAVVFVVYRVFLGPEELLRHITAATGPRTFSVETPTPPDQLGRLALAVRQVGFSLGLPLTLVAAAGSVVMARRKRREGLGLAAMAIGYYTGFLLILPYQTVRYLLPITLLAGISVAAGLSLVRRFGNAGRLGVVALSMVLGLALSRGLWVDASMVADSRYDVEQWLSRRGAAGQTLAFGKPLTMPRGVTVSALRNLVTGGCGFLDDKKPEYLLINLAEVRSEKEAAAVRRLADDGYNYRQVMRHRTRVPFEPLGVRQVLSNLDKINPEILVLGRSEGPCLDAENLPAHLETLMRNGSPALRRQLARFISAPGLAGRKQIPGDAGALAFGLQYGGWTRGTQPAAVLVTNTSRVPADVVLGLNSLAPAGTYPMDVFIDDGFEARRYTFAGRGRLKAPGGRLSPGERRLLLIRSEKAWPSTSGERVLGVGVNAVELAP